VHIVLYPHYKLEYFKRNGWDETLIQAACNIVQDKFDWSYWLLDIEEDNIATQTNRDVVVSCSSSFAHP
jgi:hypothetical protein